MNNSRLEWKVGVFVLVALLLLMGLLLRFSKGTPLWTSTYQLQMETENVAGIIPGAAVVMSGVGIGHVLGTELAPSGKKVTVFLEILQKYRIHEDAVFSIRQAGFLGDRFVAVTPLTNAGEILQNNDVVVSQETFDLEEVARSAAGLLKRVDESVQKLGAVVDRVDRTVLGDEALVDLTSTMKNLRLVTVRALKTLDSVDDFVQTNSLPLSSSVSNLVIFSENLNDLSIELHDTVVTNRAEFSGAMKNIRSATERVDRLFSGLEEGEGLAGGLLKDDGLRTEFAGTVRNLNLLSSNLNRFGLLWKPRVKRTVASPEYTGKNPHR